MSDRTGTMPAIGMVGLGRMGANLVRRLVDAGGSAQVYDVDAGVAEALAAELGDAIGPARTLGALVDALPGPRTVWVMVPAEQSGRVVSEVAELLSPGDVVIDGGNTDWREDAERAAALGERGIELVDVGTSGGVWGLERGYCLMVGGDSGTVERLAPLFDVLSPAADSVERTPGRDGETEAAERGWLHCGPTGSGHFVKMVHNGIEYGMMAAYAEGLNLLASARPYGFDVDLADITELWRRGSVVGSWLLDLTAAALVADPGSVGLLGRRRRLGRRPVVGPGRGRSRCPDSGAVGSALLALRLTGQGVDSQQGVGGDATAVRRSRRAAR
ncbi:MAG: NADP-dependent phosphogluconate dehydrogenase [Microthrixaceae bacterium]